MPKIVVVGGFVECKHSGRTKLKSGNAKLKIGGAEVVIAGGEVGVSFMPLTVPPTPPTPDNPAPCIQQTAAGTPSPCAITLLATSGISTKIKVDGVGVLLDTASGLATNPNDPSAQWTISDAGQALMEEA
ncbi:MAG TPA: hypothetical protein VN281_12670 [Verrucomicrobiae bacterium]|jgi:hypothetical protein|nr:hypothetical protein [Verrucomicrobiae bacterium]